MKRAALVLLLSAVPAIAGPPRRTKTLKGHHNFVTSLDIHPEGRLVVSAAADGTVRIWSVEAAKSRRTVSLPDAAVARKVLFSPDGKSIAVVVDNQVLLWNSAGEEKRRWELDEPATGIAFSPDSSQLAVAAGAVRVLVLQTGEEAGRFGEQVLGVAFSADGKAVAVAGKRGVMLFPRPEGSSRSLSVAPARDVAFGCDGKCIVAAGEDGVVRALAPDTGAEMWSHAELASDGKLGMMGPLVLAAIGENRVWALGGASGQQEWFLEGKTDDLQTFALAPNAKLLATAGEDSTIDLWAWK